MSEAWPQRILVAGDMHANTGAALEVVDQAARVGAHMILQVGDFGFWPRDAGGRSFLAKLDRQLALRELQLWWVDGNHEDFDRLTTRPIGSDGRRQVAEHIWHLPRGHRWTWGETSWLAAGGAVSMDRAYRTSGETWFEQEEMTGSEADAIIASGPAEVLIGHDAPLGVPTLRRALRQDLPAWRRESEWPTTRVITSDEHQRRIRRILDGVRANLVFHGHYHLRYSDTLTSAHGQVQVHGLGMDLDPLADRCLLVDHAGQPISMR